PAPPEVQNYRRCDRPEPAERKFAKRGPPPGDVTLHQITHVVGVNCRVRCVERPEPCDQSNFQPTGTCRLVSPEPHSFFISSARAIEQESQPGHPTLVPFHPAASQHVTIWRLSRTC